MKPDDWDDYVEEYQWERQARLVLDRLRYLVLRKKNRLSLLPISLPIPPPLPAHLQGWGGDGEDIHSPSISLPIDQDDNIYSPAWSEESNQALKTSS
jgi:hypothetical protein